MIRALRSPRKYGIWFFVPKIEMTRGMPLILEPDAPVALETVQDVARMPAATKAHVERADFAVKVAGFSL